jgi:hypothetical protein
VSEQKNTRQADRGEQDAGRELTEGAFDEPADALPQSAARVAARSHLAEVNHAGRGDEIPGRPEVMSQEDDRAFLVTQGADCRQRNQNRNQSGGIA